MKSKVIFLIACLSFEVQVFSQVSCPVGTIVVGSNCHTPNLSTCHSCSDTLNVYDFETYVKSVLAQEWIYSWGVWPNGMNSLEAGAVAIRSYSLSRMNNPLYIAKHNNGAYNICNNTCCQVYSTFQSPLANAAVDNTANYILVDGNGNAGEAEFAAETNDNYPGVPQTSGKFWGQCGDGKFQKSVVGPIMNGGDCYPHSTLDHVCLGIPYDPNSHPRGMCQRGSARWATGYTVPSNSNMGVLNGYPTKTWQELLSYYYPYWTLTTCHPPTCNWQQMAGVIGSGLRSPIAFAINQYGYVGGGEKSSNSSNPYYPDDFYRYDITSNQWVQKGTMGGGPRNAGVSFVIITHRRPSNILLNTEYRNKSFR